MCHFHSQYILYLSTEQGDAEAKPAAAPPRRRPGRPPQGRPDWVHPEQFHPKQGDMWINTIWSQSPDAMVFRFFARNCKDTFDDNVPSAQQKKVQYKQLNLTEEELLSWLKKQHVDRLAGFEYSRELLRTFGGDMYYKTDDGTCYQVIDKCHYKVVIPFWNALCEMTFNQGEVNQVNQVNKEQYLAAAATGQGPLYNTQSHGHLILIRNKASSISHEEKYQEMNSDGKVSALAAENNYVKKEGDRFIDDVYQLAKHTGIEYVQFATRESIIKILGGAYTPLGSDFDESSYYGCIITDAPAMGETMHCRDHLFSRLREYMRAALCNPLTGQGGAIMPGDIFIFHSKYFHDGPTGKEDLMKCGIKKTKKYV